MSLYFQILINNLSSCKVPNDLQYVQVDLEKLMILNSNAKLEKETLVSVTSQTSGTRISLRKLYKLLQQTLWRVKECQKSLWQNTWNTSAHSILNPPTFVLVLLDFLLNHLTYEGNVAIQFMNDQTNFPTQSSLFQLRKVFQENELIKP